MTDPVWLTIRESLERVIDHKVRRIDTEIGDAKISVYRLNDKSVRCDVTATDRFLEEPPRVG